VTDTLTELKRLHAEYVEACGPFKPYSYLVAPNEMTLSALQNAFETAAAVEIPKLLACVEALEGLHDDTVEYVTLNKLHDADGSPAINNHWMKQARAALASLKGGA